MKDINVFVRQIDDSRVFLFCDVAAPVIAGRMDFIDIYSPKVNWLG